MVAVMAQFFGTIIPINLAMVNYASRSWSGLVVENALVTSLQFNDKIAETHGFQARGIKGELISEPGAFCHVLSRKGKRERAVDQVVAALKRRVEEHEDIRVELQRTGEGVFISTQGLKPVRWIADVAIMSGRALVYLKTIRFVVLRERQ